MTENTEYKKYLTSLKQAYLAGGQLMCYELGDSPEINAKGKKPGHRFQVVRGSGGKSE